MSMILVLRSINDAEIDSLLGDPERVLELLEDEGTRTGAESIDLDKAWHGIHYLLTGSAWEGGSPLGYLVEGGEPVGEVDVGYGPARVLRPSQVQEFGAALEQVAPEHLQQRFDPRAMMKADIYPSIWGRNSAEDDALGYLLDHFQRLRAFVAQVRQLGKGLVFGLV